MAIVNVRVTEETKAAASKTLADIGLDMSAAVNIFLRQVIVEKGLPFKPSKTPSELRAQWDAEVQEVLGQGKGSNTVRDLFRSL